MRFWQIARWSLLVLCALALTLLLARLFSGPEDTWVRDASGRWVAHGHPAGAPPAADVRQEPEGVLPFLFIAVFLLALVAAAVLAPRSPASPDLINRSIRFLGATSVIAVVLAATLALGIVIIFAVEMRQSHGPEVVDLETVAVLLGLAGLAAFLALLGAQVYGARKVLEAHYDLKRQMALLQDAVERLSR